MDRSKVIGLTRNAAIAAPLYSAEQETAAVHKIGGSYYEVVSRFSRDGTETVLQQFTDLLKEANII